MTKRLTAEEVAEKIEQECLSYDHSPGVIRDNLIPQWQDEPDGDGGLVWVRFADDEKNSYRWTLPYVAWKEDGEWWIEDWGDFTMRLDGRKVCPITPRPKD
jgi:hypothetical protein